MTTLSLLRARLLPLAAAFALLVAACGGAADSTPAPTPVGSTPASAAATDATPTATTASCTAPATPTTSVTEGPYFKAGSPQTSTLYQAGMAGTRLTLTGQVLSTTCTPVAGAVVDIWHADSTGTYDNAGYTLRGHVLTDAMGAFRFSTIIPGEYPGRTEHIHVKITPPGGATLTTQLFFPGTAANDSDGIYSPDLLLDLTSAGDHKVGTFTFVVAV